MYVSKETKALKFNPFPSSSSHSAQSLWMSHNFYQSFFREERTQFDVGTACQNELRENASEYSFDEHNVESTRKMMTRDFRFDLRVDIYSVAGGVGALKKIVPFPRC